MKGIGILTVPIGESGFVPLGNIIDIVCSAYPKIYMVSGLESIDHFREDQRVVSKGVSHSSGKGFLSRTVRFLHTQTKIAIQVALISRRVRTWIFFFGGDISVFPMFIARILRKRVLLVLPGSSSLSLAESGDDMARLLALFSRLNCSLANKVIVYSANLVSEWKLERFEDKIRIAPHNLIDFNTFRISTEYCDRKPMLGYIGRLSKEKGVVQLMKAMPEILITDPTLRFTIVGDGELRPYLMNQIAKCGLDTRVELKGWIAHQDIPGLLNSLRLLVIPSSTEGLPNIMLEAMACGTPVVASSVGAIPDIVVDNESGFLMADNSPESISRNVTRALGYPNLKSISTDANQHIAQMFRNDRVISSWTRLLGEDNDE